MKVFVTIDAFNSERRRMLSIPEILTPQLKVSTYSKKVYSMEWSTTGAALRPLLLAAPAGAKNRANLVPKAF